MVVLSGAFIEFPGPMSQTWSRLRFMVFAAVAMIAATQTPAPNSATFEKWGKETLATIRRDFYMPGRGLYADALTPNEKPKQVAFNWGCGVMLSALNAAARTDSKYDAWLREYADASRSYWNTKGPVPGYDVLPGPKDVDRYYDDNQWMAMALVETYEHLHDPKYLDWASQTLTYILSGESGDLGGGIFWKEAEKTSKNTCSNAPAAAACLAVYEHTQDRALLRKAVELYSWTKKNLRNPLSGLMWDSISLSGKVERTEWSYNTALMIRTASRLYALTGLKSYADDAIAFEQSSVPKWIRSDSFTDPGRFAHLLFESWIIQQRDVSDLPGVNRGIRALEALHANSRSDLGLYPDRWNAKPPQGKVELIDQASAARAFFMASDFLKKNR